MKDVDFVVSGKVIARGSIKKSIGLCTLDATTIMRLAGFNQENHERMARRVRSC